MDAVAVSHEGEDIRRIVSLEVPEVREGVVRIREVGRLKGRLTKIALDSVDSGIDPVGAVVGMQGGRIRAIVHALGGEMVDLIPWHADRARYFRLVVMPFTIIAMKLDTDGKRVDCVVEPLPPELRTRAFPDVTERVASLLTGWDFSVTVRSEAV
jgi:N utilization substance protein A